MALYETLLLAHVLGVVVWLGGSLTMLLLLRRSARSDNELTVAAQVETLLWFDSRLAIPASLVVLLAGGWLMSDGNWAMDQGWLHIGMAGVFAGAGVSLLWTRRYGRAVLSKGVSAALIGRISLGMLASIGIVLIAFWAMIAKPWS